VDEEIKVSGGGENIGAPCLDQKACPGVGKEIWGKRLKGVCGSGQWRGKEGL